MSMYLYFELVASKESKCAKKQIKKRKSRKQHNAARTIDHGNIKKEKTEKFRRAYYWNIKWFSKIGPVLLIIIIEDI